MPRFPSEEIFAVLVAIQELESENRRVRAMREILEAIDRDFRLTHAEEWTEFFVHGVREFALADRARRENLCRDAECQEDSHPYSCALVAWACQFGLIAPWCFVCAQMMLCSPKKDGRLDYAAAAKPFGIKPNQTTSLLIDEPYPGEAVQPLRAEAHELVERHYDMLEGAHGAIKSSRRVSLDTHSRWLVLNVVGGDTAAAIAERYKRRAVDVSTVEKAVRKLAMHIGLRDRFKKGRRIIGP